MLYALRAGVSSAAGTSLGTGTVSYAIALWYTEGRQVIGVLPDGFLSLYMFRVLGIPIAAYYVLAAAVIIWIVAEYLPIGRCLYASAPIRAPRR